jgi:hypothetical protein
LMSPSVTEGIPAVALLDQVEARATANKIDRKTALRWFHTAGFPFEMPASDSMDSHHTTTVK